MSQHLDNLQDEWAKQQQNHIQAQLHAKKCHREISTVQHKLLKVQSLLDQLKQQKQDLHTKTAAAVASCSTHYQLVKSIAQDIHIAKAQLKVYRTIMYNTHADLLDECPLNKQEILAKMEEEKVHDPNSMDNFLTFMYVEGFLLEFPSTGGSAPTQALEQEGETKESAPRC